MLICYSGTWLKVTQTIVIMYYQQTAESIHNIYVTLLCNL